MPGYLTRSPSPASAAGPGEYLVECQKHLSHPPARATSKTSVWHDRQMPEALACESGCRVVGRIELASASVTLLVARRGERLRRVGLNVFDLQDRGLHAFLELGVDVFRNERIDARRSVHQRVVPLFEVGQSRRQKLHSF